MHVDDDPEALNRTSSCPVGRRSPRVAVCHGGFRHLRIQKGTVHVLEYIQGYRKPWTLDYIQSYHQARGRCWSQSTKPDM